MMADAEVSKGAARGAAPVRNIVIVGGGTAGWMVAAAFARFLPKTHDITLVESDAIGTVGVGEATIPQIRLFNQALGIAEDKFVKATMGSFKLGIEFDGWQRAGKKYIHAFGNIGRPFGLVPFHHYWLKALENGADHSLWEYSATSKAAYQNRFAPLTDQPGAPPMGVAWAYHFDAGLYAAFLRRHAEQAGVTRIEGKVDSVQADGPDSHIASITLEDGQKVEGDFFIDCTGFRGLLIGQEMGADYSDWTHWLPCDRAMAVPCESVSPITPYTRATARQAGWQWRIPLQHRTGNGHVYSSAHMSDDEAASVLLANLDGAALADPKPLKFTTGMRPRSWTGNCVAIGLAAGFMEPLESTSIHLIQSAIERVLKFFPVAGFAAADIDTYNRQTVFEWESIRDFLILHYHANSREEPFWQERRAMDIPETLKARMALFNASGRITREHEELFTEQGWIQLMVGQGLKAGAYHPLADTLEPAQLDEFLGLARRHTDATAAKMMPHDDFIARHCAAIIPESHN